MAAPSFRNSGLETTSNFCLVLPAMAALHLVAGADRDRALVDDDRVAGHMRSDIARCAEHVFQVRGTVLSRRRSHGNEDDVRFLNGGTDIGGKAQPAVGHVPLDQFLKPRFIDRYAACIEQVDLFFIDVHAGDITAAFSKAGAGNEANIACSDYGDLHVCSPSVVVRKKYYVTSFRRKASPAESRRRRETV